MDLNGPIKRQQLELVIQKKKLDEVYSWFNDHFVKCSRAVYMSRCPFVIVQGPTGCGKTSTLRWVSNELNLAIREYSETTDTTAIDYDLSRTFAQDVTNSSNLSLSIERRKASKFEQFVINNIMYNPIFPDQPEDPIEESDEWDTDDEMDCTPIDQRKPATQNGIIIHVDSTLTFAKSQRILIQTLLKLYQIIRNLSRRLMRRVAIVFETLECEGESLSLPKKIKQSLEIHVLKFNSITKANMKKLIEFITKDYSIEKETIDILAVDSDGDIRACLNSLHLLCNRPTDSQVILSSNSTLQIPVSKKQKLHHEARKKFKLCASLMRDTTKSLGFFHVLGKIFYQKRIYPIGPRMPHQSLARPYPPENSTEYLTSMLDLEPKKLIAWLHEHYYKFCLNNIETAALFLDNISSVDRISLCSTQSSQFYESHTSLDSNQTDLAVIATVFSLYKDQSNVSKSSHKRINTPDGPRIVKTSVDCGSGGAGELCNFTKPQSLSLENLVVDYKNLLDRCTQELFEIESTPLESSRVLIDYVPYLSNMYKLTKPNPEFTRTRRIVEALDRFEENAANFEQRHEITQELIEDLGEQVRDYHL